MKLTDIADKFAVYSDLCASSGVECRIVLFSRVYDILQSEFCHNFLGNALCREEILAASVKRIAQNISFNGELILTCREILSCFLEESDLKVSVAPVPSYNLHH